MQPWWAEETSIKNIKHLTDPKHLNSSVTQCLKAYFALYFFIFHRTEIQSWLKTKAATLVLKTLLMSPAWISLRRMKPLFLRTLAFPSLFPSDRRTLRPTLSGNPMYGPGGCGYPAQPYMTDSYSSGAYEQPLPYGQCWEDYSGNIIGYRSHVTLSKMQCLG